MNKRQIELKRIATYGLKQGVKELKEDEKKEDQLDEYAMTPYGSKFKFKGSDAHTYIMLSHNRRGFFL